MKNKKQSQSETELSPALRAKCTKIRTLLAKEAEGNKPAYLVGVEVHAVRKDPDKYASGSVEAMANEIGCTAALLYSYSKVAEAWPSAEKFGAMTDKPNAKGLPLTFSHFIEIAKADPKMRANFFDAALKDSLSVRALKQAVAGTRTKRKPKPLTDARAMVSRLFASSNAALTRAEGEKADLTRLIGSEDAGTLPTADHLGDTIVTLKKLSVTYGLLSMHLEELRKRCAAGKPSLECAPLGLLPPVTAPEASPSNAGQDAPKKAVGT